MARFWKRRSAYYSHNDSYSRSYNAEMAEMEGRLPQSRAAKALGLTMEAFKQGRYAINYFSSEWHHVGKYATPVNYYDTNEVKNEPEFWKAASLAYKSKKKRTEIFKIGLKLEMAKIIPPAKQLIF